jgi:hypothetical protein
MIVGISYVTNYVGQVVCVSLSRSKISDWFTGAGSNVFPQH